MNQKSQLRNYILENYIFSDDESLLKDSDSFLDQGILDSTGILELIFFIEESYDIKVEDDEMVPENLDSIDNLLSYLKKKQS